MTQINTFDEAKLAFDDWCKGNAHKLSNCDFVMMYGISLNEFYKKYWTRGLQQHWIKWHKKLKEKKEGLLE